MKAGVVLVIEDNPITLKLVRLTLGNEGWTVIEAGDATEALALVLRRAPDLILQDLLLPDMDGAELVRRLRAVPEMIGVPIIAFSGFLSRLEHGRAAAMGFNGFIPKPVEPSRLVQVVRTYLRPDLAAAPVGRRQSVLVVDDDPVQLKHARIRLAGLGWTVDTATDGAEALEVVRRGGTEAIVSDVLMPRLDGFGLCAAVRKELRLSNIPIVLVSSNYVEEADRRLAADMGATALVVRTPDLAGVIEALETALDAPPAPPVPSVHSMSIQHHERVLRQLERQAGLNADSAQRSAMYASVLSAVAGMSEALTKRRSIEDSAPDILTSLLDASGVSMGAIFVRHTDALGPAAPDDFVLRAHAGFSAAAGAGVGAFFGHRAILEGAVTSKSPVVMSAGSGRPVEQNLLARAGMTSALVVPCVANEECQGILLLGSKARDLTESDWIPFARTMAVQIGQALSVSRLLSQLVHEAVERTHAEERLRASLKEVADVRAALDQHAIVAITDRRGTITYANDKCCEISKYSREELVGHHHRLVSSGHHPKEFIRQLWNTAAHGRVWQGQMQNKAKGGSSYWVNTTIVPFLDEVGNPRQYVAIGADITQQKAAESEILQLNADLEGRVVQRTADLEIANKELEAFAYSISHDLRSPLRAVNGFAEMVLLDCGPQLPETARGYLDRVCQGSRRMGELIDDLLAFSRMSRQMVTRQTMSFTVMVREVWEELAPQRKGRQIDLRIGDLPACKADPRLMKQVWANLLANAIKFTRRRDLAIVEIGCDRAHGEDRFFVRDNGVGFDMRYVSRLFKVFHRLHRDDEFEGTGAGLAIVQRILNRHGGRIWAEAEVDRGATFHFVAESAGATRKDAYDPGQHAPVHASSGPSAPIRASAEAGLAAPRSG